MKKNRLSLLAISLLSISSLFAQSTKNRVLDQGNMRDGEHVEYCGNAKKMAEAMKNPEFAANYKEAQATLAQEEAEKSKKPNGTTKGIVYTIPVVFHVLHNGGAENISKEQIMSTLAILNRDYRKLNADANTVQPEFTSLVADIEIEFALATKAPNGACFSGITRTQSALSYSGGDGQAQVNAIVAGNDVFQGQWAPSKYMNVYICGDIGGAAGYTFNPPGGTSMYFNGIFVLHNYVGDIGTSSVFSSRTLTHEVGHWYNLSHTWGGNNNPGVDCSGSDGVADTPTTIGVSTCNLNENTCGPKANVENYMDYSYCSKMFTTGQSTRMRNACVSSTSGRNNLWTAGNLTFTGANAPLALCQAKFSAPKQIVCSGEALQFTDESYNVATGWSWTFNGGSPSTSTLQNPSVTYSTPGTYTVELVATDGTSSNTKTMTNYITVLPAGEALPVLEGFESLTDFSSSTRWDITNPAGNGWTITSTAANSGLKSAKLTNFGQAVDNVDELISSSINLSGITTSATISFRYAYRKRTSTNADILKVYATKDCGDNWDIRKSLSATTMSGGVSVTTAWTPTSADWVTVHMTNITSLYWVDNFRFKFEFTSDGGNNMYLDDINIYSGTPADEPSISSGIEETLFQNTSVYPNPTDGDVNVRFTAQSAQDLDILVTDLSGKTIQKHFIQAKTGENLVMLSSEGMAKGMYLIQLTDGSRHQTLQFVVK